jgi:hypothetical protein
MIDMDTKRIDIHCPELDKTMENFPISESDSFEQSLEIIRGSFNIQEMSIGPWLWNSRRQKISDFAGVYDEELVLLTLRPGLTPTGAGEYPTPEYGCAFSTIPPDSGYGNTPENQALTPSVHPSSDDYESSFFSVPEEVIPDQTISSGSTHENTPDNQSITLFVHPSSDDYESSFFPDPEEVIPNQTIPSGSAQHNIPGSVSSTPFVPTFPDDRNKHSFLSNPSVPIFSDSQFFPFSSAPGDAIPPQNKPTSSAHRRTPDQLSSTPFVPVFPDTHQSPILPVPRGAIPTPRDNTRLQSILNNSARRSTPGHPSSTPFVPVVPDTHQSSPIPAPQFEVPLQPNPYGSTDRPILPMKKFKLQGVLTPEDVKSAIDDLNKNAANLPPSTECRATIKQNWVVSLDLIFCANMRRPLGQDAQWDRRILPALSLLSDITAGEVKMVRIKLIESVEVRGGYILCFSDIAMVINELLDLAHVVDRRLNVPAPPRV